MKKLVATLTVFMLMISVSFAQEIEPTFEKQEDLVKATYYHDNGMVKEVGFFKSIENPECMDRILKAAEHFSDKKDFVQIF